MQSNQPSLDRIDHDPECARLEAYELMAGDQMTSFGPFSEVVR
jgi:hypothetical protein